MSQYSAYFRRYEKKYLLSREQFAELSRILPEYFEPDIFHKSLIRNIYLDTDNNRLVRASNEKPDYKEKLRIRMYEDPDREARAFLELKKKYDGVVYKRREAVPLSELRDQDIFDKKDTQIMKEIRYLFQFYGKLKAAMFLSYKRIALRGKEDPELRITFDGDIRYRTDNLTFEAGIGGRPLLEQGQVLMEIKTPEAIPLWFSKILSELGIYPVSFSKYGKAFLTEEAARIAAEFSESKITEAEESDIKDRMVSQTPLERQICA
ncbi:MAG: polyphosphate polymerase domain-containing protein [Eubacteriaceae bacterium]